MGRQSSLNDSDGTTWLVTALRLGERGLDLRRPDDAETMTELLNARFVDSRTIGRRDGHTGQEIQDRSEFILGKRVTDEWVYGHGTRLAIDGNDLHDNKHHPVSNRGAGTFSYKGTEVVWTGDRLLVEKNDGAFYGRHPHWNRTATTPLEMGIPAYLPVQTDSYTPVTIKGTYVATCLTESIRVIAHDSAGRVEAHIIRRDNGSLIQTNLVDGNNGACTKLRLINSGGTPAALWVNSGGLQVSFFSGTAWSTPSTISASTVDYDTCEVDGGFHVVWRVAGAIFIGRFFAADSSDYPYPFGTSAFVGDTTPAGVVAVGANLQGAIAIAWASTLGLTPAGINTLYYSPDMDVPVDAIPLLRAAPADSIAALSVCFRQLRDSQGRPSYLVHSTITPPTSNPYATIHEVSPTGTLGATVEVTEDTIHNAVLMTKGFRVGDEVMAWFQTNTTQTNFLAAGCVSPQIVGVCDREEATDPPGWLGVVGADPIDEDRLRFSWIRSYNAGDYFRPGNTRTGDLNFAPKLSAVQFGHSMYLAGSHPRNWDGVELGDAGFNDYPTVVSVQQSNSTGLLTAGVYQYRVYAVRYNAQGERFQSAAVTGSFTVIGLNDTVATTLSTMALTNHDDVVFEFYRTEMGQTTFRLEGTVANTKSTEGVTFTSTLADADLRTKPGDPHAAIIGIPSETEEMAPIGCETFVVAGDRLWGVGGQIPAGTAQFSKLYEVNEGAGFDALAGTQVVDATGGKITSIVAFSDTTIVAFQAERNHVIAGSGPDNYGQGGFGPPELFLADGAINHEGSLITPVGVVFWSESGPRLLGSNFQVQNISEPVSDLAKTMTPTGVQCDISRSEVVWYTAEGDALLWCYSGGQSRWARWTGLPVAGCSRRRLVTTRGRVLTQADVGTDAGVRFEFRFGTGNIRTEESLNGGVLLQQLGLAGKCNGSHRVTFRVYYNGSPQWSERFRWEPLEGTYLTPVSDWAALTPAQIDALGITYRSGSYGTMKRAERVTCRFFRVVVSDGGDPGFTPYELSFRVGVVEGAGRKPVNSFKD